MNVLKHKYLVGLTLLSLALIGMSAPVFASPTNGSSHSFADSTENIRIQKNDCRDSLAPDKCATTKLLVNVTNIMAGITGLIIVGSLIFAGIQYSMAGADSSKVQAAKHRISSALIALIFFIFGFALLQWLIPGGVF